MQKKWLILPILFMGGIFAEKIYNDINELPSYIKYLSYYYNRKVSGDSGSQCDKVAFFAQLAEKIKGNPNYIEEYVNKFDKDGIPFKEFDLPESYYSLIKNKVYHEEQIKKNGANNSYRNIQKLKELDEIEKSKISVELFEKILKNFIDKEYNPENKKYSFEEEGMNFWNKPDHKISPEDYNIIKDAFKRYESKKEKKAENESINMPKAKTENELGKNDEIRQAKSQGDGKPSEAEELIDKIIIFLTNMKEELKKNKEPKQK